MIERNGAQMMDIAVVADRVRRVRARIDAAGGGPHVRLMAVTKGFGAEAVRAAIEAGVTDIGENYAQELVVKLRQLGSLPPEVTVHFIGRIQTNKVRILAPFVRSYQSVDRASIVSEIAKRAPGSAVFIQLNLSGEQTKGGCDAVEARRLVPMARDLGLDVRGLMGVGLAGDPELARPGFSMLVELADEMGLPERSIGMSGDLEVAVAEGSTMVRVGRDLFGPRPVVPSSGL